MWILLFPLVHTSLLQYLTNGWGAAPYSAAGAVIGAAVAAPILLIPLHFATQAIALSPGVPTPMAIAVAAGMLAVWPLLSNQHGSVTMSGRAVQARQPSLQRERRVPAAFVFAAPLRHRILAVRSVTVYYVALVLQILLGNPESVISESLHHEVGQCNVTELDLAGRYLQLYGLDASANVRGRFLCASDFDERMTFKCSAAGFAPPSPGSRWYTVCGVPFDGVAHRWTCVAAVVAISTIGVASFQRASIPDPNVEPTSNERRGWGVYIQA